MDEFMHMSDSPSQPVVVTAGWFPEQQSGLSVSFQDTTPHRIDGNQKCSEQSTNADKKSLETVFSISICRQSGNKWQSKTLFLTFLSTFVDSNNIFDNRLSGVNTMPTMRFKTDLFISSQALNIQLQHSISCTSQTYSQYIFKTNQQC